MVYFKNKLTNQMEHTKVYEENKKDNFKILKPMERKWMVNSGVMLLCSNTKGWFLFES